MKPRAPLFFLLMSLLLLFVTVSASAGIDPVKRLRNADLVPQMENQKFRVLPQLPNLSLASDTHFLYRVTHGDFPYYHAGYWMDNFVELRAVKKLAINSRLTFYNPAMSYGVVSHFFFLPLVSFDWKDNLLDYGGGDWKIDLRLMDLDRQTLGAGLTLADKEMSGVHIQVTHDDFRIRYLQDGTGGYDISGDVNYLSLDYKKELIGAYAFQYHFGRAGFLGLYSKAAVLPWLETHVELAERHGGIAGLAAVRVKGDFGESAQVTADLQFRKYGNHFADDIKGRIEHDYLSPEQEDKPMMDSMNIFVHDDDVYAPGLRLGGVFKVWKALTLTMDHEVAIFHYKNAGVQQHYFFKYALSACSSEQGFFCVEFVASNKYTSAFRRADYNDMDNKFTFGKKEFLGLEAYVKL